MPADKPREVEPPGGDRPASAGAADEGLSSLLRRGVKAAIARWAVRRRGEPEIWPRPQDEAPHPWDGRRHFAEDYTFAAVQPELALIARVEWLPGREAHRVWLTLLTPDAVFALPGTGQALLRGGGDHWRAGGVALDCTEPLRAWTVRYRGRLEVRDPRGHRRRPARDDLPAEDLEVRVDLTFVSQVPTFVPGRDDDPDLVSRQIGAAEWDARLLKQLRRNSLRSYVQPGEVHGSIALGNQLLAFGGAGLRHHGWGVRDWGASDSALQCLVSLPGAHGPAGAHGPGGAHGPTGAHGQGGAHGPAGAHGQGGAHGPAGAHGSAGAQAGPLRAWVHTAQFPWLRLAGGFVQRAAGVVPIRDLGVAPTRRPDRAPSHVGLHIDAPGGALELEAETLSELALDMDGRGRLELALCRVHGAGAGWALMIHQQRLLPRVQPSP